MPVNARDMAPGEARRLFDDNAPTYDAVNTVISLGLDARWREWVVRRVAAPGAHVLDAFSGTGEVGIRAARLGAAVTLADISPVMLQRAEAQARDRGVAVNTCLADLTGPLPDLPGAPFDAISVVFGVRYLVQPAEVLARLATLLKERGELVVMEFVTPQRGWLAKAAAVYFFRVLPHLAGLLAGQRELYERLTATTRTIHGPEGLEAIVREAGLSVTETRVMGFGLVVGVVARPPER